MRKAFLLLGTALLLAGCGGKGEGPIERVRVPAGSSFSQVADTLSARGIIKGKPLFKLYARISGSDGRIKPGTYGFRKKQSWESILTDLREGDVLTLRFVIPEGWSLDRIAKRMASLTEQDSTAVLEMLMDSAFVAQFGVPGPTLEGYLYPATYEFDVGIPVDSVVRRLVGRYQQAWTPALRARADSINMNEREVVTLASIVEKEAKRREEMPLIASVYHNRLRIGMALQADPTVQYALGGHRARLLYSHIRDAADNPYNTYANRGLPPGPIGSPSSLAIKAVLYPDTTRFLYFVARPDGSHVFTRSLAEHNRAKVASRRAAAAPAAVDSTRN